MKGYILTVFLSAIYLSVSNLYASDTQAVAQCNGRDVTVMLSLGEMPTSGNDVILGTPLDDNILGMGGNDTICALGGNDSINGGRGEDWIDAGPGNDTVLGGNDDDQIYGDDGVDSLFGGPGNDTVNGEAGDDFLMGNSGDDILDGGDGIDRISGGSGEDYISVGKGSNFGTVQLVTGGSGNDTMFGGPDVDVLQGESGDDIIYGGLSDDLLYGGAGADIIYGNGGDDLLRGNGGVDLLYGGRGDDRLDGLGGNDVLYGGTGVDNLTGSTGIDTLYGQAGDDLLHGGGGNDVLDGNRGIDSCDGAGGNGNTADHCETETNITAGGLIADQSWKQRLYTPTSITKLGELYFIVDCWHHRVIYTDSLITPIGDWNLLDDRLAGPHSIASDGEFYLVDDTGRHGLKVYRQFEAGLLLVQQLRPLGIRTHRVRYDEVGNAFYVLSSNSQSITKLVVDGEALSVVYTKSLPFLDRVYTRSFTIVDNAMYFTSGPGVITKTRFRDESFEVLGSFDVPEGIRVGNDIFRSEDGWWYFTGATRNIIRARSLEAREAGVFEDVYEELGLDGNPYYLSYFDGHYYVPQIFPHSGIRSFDHDANANITNVQTLFDFGQPTPADYERRESWPL